MCLRGLIEGKLDDFSFGNVEFILTCFTYPGRFLYTLKCIRPYNILRELSTGSNMYEQAWGRQVHNSFGL